MHRRGVTETITVIPCVAAQRYALHHSSFIWSLASLFCVSLSVWHVAFLCLACLLCLSAYRFLTCTIYFSACFGFRIFKFYLRGLAIHSAVCQVGPAAALIVLLCHSLVFSHVFNWFLLSSINTTYVYLSGIANCLFYLIIGFSKVIIYLPFK